VHSILMKGIIRNGRVEVAEPINLPDGSEVTITGCVPGELLGPVDHERPMTPNEIAETLAAMAKVEPFDMTTDERAGADAWEKRVNEYTIANMDRGIEDIFP
jgi:hypothetical protein